MIPPTVPGAARVARGRRGRGELQVTDGARRVLDLFLHPPEEAEWRPILRGVSRLAFATLPAAGP